jgi:hypothetical protein
LSTSNLGKESDALVSSVRRSERAFEGTPGPFPGLRPFEEIDADFYFGRYVEIHQIRGALSKDLALAQDGVASETAGGGVEAIGV